LLRGQAIGEVKQISPKIFGGVVDAAQKTVAKAREVARQAVSRAGMSRSKGDVMSDEVSRFRVNVHEKLETLQSRMGSLELNSGTTWHLLQEKLDEMRHRDKARQSAVADARAFPPLEIGQRITAIDGIPVAVWFQSLFRTAPLKLYTMYHLR